MKDLGTLTDFHGIELARSETGTLLSQGKYLMDLHTKTRMLGCNHADTPIEINHKL